MRKLPRDISRQSGQAVGIAGQSALHDSAWLHVRGQARYIDDLREPEGLLHAAVGHSEEAHARITSMDLSAVRAYPGVVAVITLADVPGHTDIGPVFPGDPVLASELVEHIGQPIFAVAATSHTAARKAARLAKVEYEPLHAVLSTQEALDTSFFVRPSHTQQRGDPDKALASAPHRLKGEINVGGQEHFYLEGQVAMVEPLEDGGMFVHTSSQHPSEVQKLVAEVLGLPIHAVQAEVRRMGGGFGGKETQAAALGCVAALLAQVTGKPIKYRLSRPDDMVQTGKRHDFFNTYDIGFDDQGLIQGAEIMVAGRCGFSPDLSNAIVERAMFHSDNSYFLDQARVTGHCCKTHTVSNTAFRGFGGPQGMMVIEQAVDDIARHLQLDPLDVRKHNLYRPGRDTTHYGQVVEQHILPELVAQLEASSDYRTRRDEITAFNQQSPILKRGLALTPVKFGISFTAKHLNQAGALVLIYTDGSLHVNHGGTEMGQGLYIKIAQVVAAAFQVDVDKVKVSATRTDKVPNTSPTAASSGSDLNGMAALDACEKIKAGLVAFAAEQYGCKAEEVRFENNQVVAGEARLDWAEFVQKAYMNRVSLSSSGFYATPKIHYDFATGKGHPFLYYANGAACSEVVLDTLTGEYRVMRTDILHDVGQSLNPAIDIGQIEGGFVQGMGWLTTEELVYNDKGRLMTTGPATYKIPAVSDTPPDLRVNLLAASPNREATVFRSKAVGEPPLMLGIAVWSALRDAVASLTDYRYSPPLDTPATPERMLNAVNAARAWANTEQETA
ncbi:xanthine dehydrogenase molybdopterin binding subunit [Pseudomonas neustonica]|uniref:Xanthine dehydrogenase molybdopterin binding subunit n=1 Tax=Pseudomonas neustonica TaxID=2487346 RepID=A0ABX9XJW4_9PSED|nr:MULTISPECIES: xanthine dehydrogenase molybdopterin binding subunit [Pseudomonas]ROZ84621.1 xanthine dehydrogenase molybdopterin binding subunit [Pseudomonas sp. SSM44]ROZ86425.1 xanthine dehydrogenase molybdopterin binding subunit [Pseudomonas neustonica]|tara:strand:+ start:2404 stop:4758 length:2355 start_codon:yes stop_codon:yes gene_type:complete